MLEFAIVGPLFIILLLLVIETAVQLAVNLALNAGVMVGSRYAITGAGSDATRYEVVRNKMLSNSGGLLNEANLKSIGTTVYANPTKHGSEGSTTALTGAAGQIVFYRVEYTQRFLTSVPQMLLGYNSITHKADLFVQNEPF